MQVNHNVVSPHQLEWLLLKRQEINFGKDVQKWEPLYTTGEYVSWYSH